MKPETTHENSEPQSDQFDSLNSSSNKTMGVITDQSNFVPVVSPGGKKKNKKLLVILVLLSIALVASSIWYLYSRHSQSSKNKISSISEVKKIEESSKQFFGNTIPEVSCTDVASLAKDKDMLRNSEGNYRCFAGEVSAGNEKIKYADIQLTSEYEKEWKSKCTLDCGFSPGDYPEELQNVGEFIVRADGRVENYRGLGGGGLDSLLSDLTGCGSGSNFGINDKLQNGTLVIDTDRVSSVSSFSKLEVKDSFDNLCTVELGLVLYLTSTSDIWESTSSIKIKRITVRTKLNDVSSCRNESAPSAIQSCYTTQAALRSDLSLCNNLISPTPKPSSNPGFDNCVIAVAKRKKDPQICDKIRYYREQFLTTCQHDAQKLKVVFDGDVIAI